MEKDLVKLSTVSGKILNDLVTTHICAEIEADDRLREALKSFAGSCTSPTVKNLRSYFKLLKLGSPYKKKALLYLRAMFKFNWLKTTLNSMAMKRVAVGKLKQISTAEVEKLKQKKEVDHVRVNETHSN